MSISSVSSSAVGAASLFGQSAVSRSTASQPFPSLAPSEGAGPSATQPRHMRHHHGPAGRVQDAMPPATLAAAQSQGGAAGTGITLSQALAAYAPSATASGVATARLL